MRDDTSQFQRPGQLSNADARFASLSRSVQGSDTSGHWGVSRDARGDGTQAGPRFLSVESVARIFDVSKVTVYREIRRRRFPAVKLRGRYVVPAKVVAAMEDAAMESGALVDPADWVQGDAPSTEITPGDAAANSPRASAFVTQQVAGHELASMTPTASRRTRRSRR